MCNLHIFHGKGLLIHKFCSRRYTIASTSTSEFQCFNKQKCRFIGAPRTLYSNHTATFQCRLLSEAGDVHPNPGPRPTCPLCEKTVRTNQKSLQCEECTEHFHIKCIPITIECYHRLLNIDGVASWTCYNVCSTNIGLIIRVVGFI